MAALPFDFNVSSVEFVGGALAAAAPFFWLPTTRLRQSVWALRGAIALWMLLPNAACR